jgi:hypothetical protein
VGSSRHSAARLHGVDLDRPIENQRTRFNRDRNITMSGARLGPWCGLLCFWLAVPRFWADTEVRRVSAHPELSTETLILVGWYIISLRVQPPHFPSPLRHHTTRQGDYRRRRRWCRSSSRSASPRVSSSAARARSGSTPMKSARSPWPTPVRPRSAAFLLRLPLRTLLSR